MRQRNFPVIYFCYIFNLFFATKRVLILVQKAANTLTRLHQNRQKQLHIQTLIVKDVEHKLMKDKLPSINYYINYTLNLLNVKLPLIHKLLFLQEYILKLLGNTVHMKFSIDIHKK